MRTGGNCRTVDRETSRFPRKELPHMPGSSTTPGRAGARADAPVRVAFRDSEHATATGAAADARAGQGGDRRLARLPRGEARAAASPAPGPAGHGPTGQP